MVLKNFTILLSGNILAQAIPFLVSPFLSRIYTPEDFGTLSVFTAIIGILSVFSTFQYENSLFLISGLETRKKFLQFLIFMLIVSTVIITFVLILVYSFKGLDNYYLLIPFGLFFYSSTRIFELYSNSKGDYKLISNQKVIKGLVENSSNLSGILKLSVPFLMCYSFILSFLTSTFYYYKTNAIDNLFYNFFGRAKIHIFFLKKYRRFFYFTFPHVLLNSLNGQLLYLLIPYYFGNQVGGLLSFGLKYIQFPLSLISASLSGLLLQNSIERLRIKEDIKDFLIKLFVVTIIVSLFYGAVILFSEAIFLTIFGDSWKKSYDFIILILPFILFNFIISIFSFIPIAINKQNHGLGIEILNTVSKLTPFVLLFSNLELNILEFLKAFNMINCLFLLIIGIWLFFLLRRYHEAVK